MKNRETAVLKQMIIITDGQSNEGVSPVVAARAAQRQGVVVSVIGIIDEGKANEQASKEIKYIAEAGGGLSRIISSRTLTHTVQSITRQAMNISLQYLVQHELFHRLGRRSIDTLSPTERGRLYQAIEEMGEQSTLQLVLLIDQSKSMQHKLPAVESAIIDLGVSLKSRAGESWFKVISFPGEFEAAETFVNWTDDSRTISPLMLKSSLSGRTPTGPAMLSALQSFLTKTNIHDEGLIPPSHKAGGLREYHV